MSTGTWVELLSLIAPAAILVLAHRLGYRRLWRRMAVLSAAVLALEIVCDPMWRTSLPHRWAYLYGDISWVMVLVYGSLYALAMLLVDRGFPRISEHGRFCLSAAVVLGLWTPSESLLVRGGIRSFPPLVTETSLSGARIPFTALPVESVFAVLAFSALILGFYRYASRLWAVEERASAGVASDAPAQRLLGGTAELVLYVSILIGLLAAFEMVRVTLRTAGRGGLSLDRLFEVGFYAAVPLAMIGGVRSMRRSRSRSLPEPVENPPSGS